MAKTKKKNFIEKNEIRIACAETSEKNLFTLNSADGSLG